MDMYQEKMQLRYHTPAEAEALMTKKAEKIAINLFKRGLSTEDIVEATELPLKRVQQIAKKYNKNNCT